MSWFKFLKKTKETVAEVTEQKIHRYEQFSPNYKDQIRNRR